MNPLLLMLSAFLFWWSAIIIHNFMNQSDTKSEKWIGLTFAYILIVIGVVCVVV